MGNYQAPRSPAISGWLWCGVIGPIFFILLFLIEGATRPGYSPWRHFVSELSLGKDGWMQMANFLLCGALVLCFAVGLRQALRTGRGSLWGPLFFGVFGVGLMVAGLFVTDPSLGYPPQAPVAVPHTLHGTIHGVAGNMVFASLALACGVLARRFAGDPAWKGWGLPSILTGIVVEGCFIASLASAILDEHGLYPDAPTGLLQRIALIIGWSWIALLALRLLSHLRVSPPLTQGPEQAEVSEPAHPREGR